MKFLKKVAEVGAICFLLLTGLSLYRTPEHEVLYEASGPSGMCHKEGCLYTYRLAVSNPGWQPEPMVTLTVRKDIMSKAVLGPSLRAEGKVSRRMASAGSSNATIYNIGNIQPGHTVEFSFSLMLDDPAEAPPWESVLQNITASQADIRPGSGPVTTLARFFFRIFTI